jgi:hypothetical protein
MEERQDIQDDVLESFDNECLAASCSPSASRKEDGWAPTLEYFNGGRVVGKQRCGSMEEAVEESRQMIKCMTDYPVSFRNNHPAPNQLIDLGGHWVQRLALPSRRFRCSNCGAKCRTSNADRGKRKYCRACESLIECCYEGMDANSGDDR